MRGRGGPVDPAESLLRRTRLRLAVLTLLTVTALVIVIGLTTAFTAITLMRQSVDRTLLLAASDPVALNQIIEGESESAAARGVLGEADTFLVLASADGQFLGASRARPEGLPDQSAIAAAKDGRDLRDARYGDTDVRLLTIRMADEAAEAEHESDDEGEEDAAATPTRYLQAGMNLSLQHRLEGQLLLAIFVIGALGVVGAMIVTVFLTGRALVPIREAFATERRFVASASHELRTPVAIIRASAEILERERLVGGEGVDLLADIIGETDRLGRLVGDLLALASAEAGALPLAPVPVDVGAWFVDLGRRAGAIAASAGVRLTVSPETVAPGLVVTADPDRLDQLVLILVDNAVAHSPAGGTVRLDLLDERPSRRVVIRVTDDGPGIPIEEQERIFEPFARGRGTRRTVGGSGLGLAIARQLALRHGAELSVESRPGAGAAFSLGLRLEA